MRVVEVVLFCLFVAAPALGQGPDDGRASARASFREGLARAQQGDSAGALLAFETAYAASPHHSVLYNIGQTQLVLGRPVDAVTTFERYLVEGRDEIPLARRSEVLELIGLQRKRIGWLRIIGPSDRKMLLWVDGVPISAEQLAGTIPLQQGKHHVLAASGAGLLDAGRRGDGRDDDRAASLPCSKARGGLVADRRDMSCTWLDVRP